MSDVKRVLGVGAKCCGKNCDLCKPRITSAPLPERSGGCGGCSACDTSRFPIMIVCRDCGNKRCPKATNHDNECTGSNEPGQTGSRYAAVAASPLDFKAFADRLREASPSVDDYSWTHPLGGLNLPEGHEESS